VEETPSCAIDFELRKKMGQIAKKVIKVSGYNNAGTVEFLLDKNKNFFFLEVNARIQVEHPITELVTGVFMKEPAGPGIRHDCGIYSGFEVPVYYDPILSKVITWAETREDARRRMILALSNYTVLGIKTTIGFLSSVMAHPEFVAGNTQTNFIEKNMSDWVNKKKERKFLNEALLAAAVSSQMKMSEKRAVVKEKAPSPWLTVGKWSVGGD